MTSTKTSPVNVAKQSRLAAMLEEMLQQALQRGFHGTLRVECAVQDGTIQNLRRSLEQQEK